MVFNIPLWDLNGIRLLLSPFLNLALIVLKWLSYAKIKEKRIVLVRGVYSQAPSTPATMFNNFHFSPIYILLSVDSAQFPWADSRER